MRRTVWTLLMALLLQLLAGSAWAWRAAQAHSHTPHGTAVVHCHGVAEPPTSATDTQRSAEPISGASMQADSHHCCAVGLALDVAVWPSPLPQAPPLGQHTAWASLSLPPDLRPPI